MGKGREELLASRRGIAPLFRIQQQQQQRDILPIVARAGISNINTDFNFLQNYLRLQLPKPLR